MTRSRLAKIAIVCSDLFIYLFYLVAIYLFRDICCFDSHLIQQDQNQIRSYIGQNQSSDATDMEVIEVSEIMEVFRNDVLHSRKTLKLFCAPWSLQF